MSSAPSLVFLRRPSLSLAVLLAAFAFLTPFHARVDLLLVPPLDAVPGVPGVAFTLHLNNPTAFDEIVALPREIEAEYASSAGHGHVTVVLANPHDTRREVLAMSRVTVELRLAEPIPADARSFVSLRLTHPLSNAIMFELDPAAPPSPPPPLDPPPAPPAEPRSPIAPDHHLDLTTDLENTRRHIFAYDPIYFAVGSRARLNARFQFSFKYRVFETAAPGAPLLEQLVRDLHFAYTQVSIWDLETLSKPFYDSSYKPTVFLLHEFRGAPRGWLLALQLGAQHESNGRGSGTTSTPGQRHPFESRSLNSFYLLTRVRWTDDSGRFAEATARASTYFDLEDNPDIARYRGYVELSLRGGYDRGFQLAVHLRGHPSGHGSAEFNATWPAVETPILKMILPPSLGGYAQIQYFNGYGESLLDYDLRHKDQLRFGLMIVR